MLVVADTSVLVNLATVGHSDILQQLFGTVMAPTAVHDEFLRLVMEEPRFKTATWPAWVEVRHPSAIPADLLSWPHRLHTGETEAIALAIEVHADFLLVDENAGRSAARAHGISVTGLVGILLRAKASGLIPAVAPILDRIVDEAGFWLGSAFRRQTLLLAGEDPDA